MHFAETLGIQDVVNSASKHEWLQPVAAREVRRQAMGAIRMAPLLPRLEDRLSLLINGRRTALPRQQTMRATLDWSYGLLTDAQQMILRRLSIFPGEFTPRAADAVISDDTYSSSEIIDQVTELIAKSLVVAEMGDPEPRLRPAGDYACVRAREAHRKRRAQCGRWRHAEYIGGVFQTR